MSSASERLIRDAVAAKLRSALPGSRVVHELVCGGNRADLAAIERDRLLLVEIKLERDTLARCEHQMRRFAEYGHAAILVAHEKWFDRKPYNNGMPRMAWPYDRGWDAEIWCFPEPEIKTPGNGYRWNLPRQTLQQPRAWTLLDLLWRDELAAECGRHRITCSGRATRPSMMEQMAWLMTGREIAEAVCRQLRKRRFPEADAAIIESLAA